jgi:hypothetical protein
MEVVRMNQAFDFNAARQRREKLVETYRAMKRQHKDDATWSWWITAQIEEIDREIADAHAAQAARNGNVVVAFPRAQ